MMLRSDSSPYDLDVCEYEGTSLCVDPCYNNMRDHRSREWWAVITYEDPMDIHLALQ